MIKVYQKNPPPFEGSRHENPWDLVARRTDQVRGLIHAMRLKSLSREGTRFKVGSEEVIFEHVSGVDPMEPSRCGGGIDSPSVTPSDPLA